MDHEKSWLSEMEGKTITAVRPVRPVGPVPTVNLAFADGSEYTVEPKRGVYFEGCLINTLRRAQPVETVDIHRDGRFTLITVEAGEFPLLMLSAENKSLDSKEFPFVLRRLIGASNG